MPGDPVVGGAPVGDHHPVEAPVLAEDPGQQLDVLAAEGTPLSRLYAAITVDGRARRTAYSKLGQVELPQRPLVHQRVDGVAAVLLVVDREMLQRRADARWTGHPVIQAAASSDGQVADPRRSTRSCARRAAVRLMFAPGPSSTLTPSARASSPSAARPARAGSGPRSRRGPTRWESRWPVPPLIVGPVSPSCLRRPCGPSHSRMRGTPSRGYRCGVQKSRPAVNATCSARVNSASSGTPLP